MFHVLRSYLKREVWQRRLDLLSGFHPWFAIAAGIVSAWVGDETALGRTELRDVVPVLLAYAAIGFGFSLAGLTIAITIPDAGFTSVLATSEPPSPDAPGLTKRQRRRRRRLVRRGANAYLDLLFVFSWTAVVHWVTLIWSVGLVVAYGLDHPFLPAGSCVARAAAGVLVALVVYSVMQFLTTVLTLDALGSTYVARLRARRASGEGDSGSAEIAATEDPGDGQDANT